MFSKLTFGQKLAIWLGCAMFVVIGGITAVFFQVSKSPPKDIDKLIPKWARGIDLKKEETWAKAEEFSTLQIEQNPKASFWYKERGYARWWLKKYDQAQDDFTKAIELDPKDDGSLAYRGQLLSYQGKYKEAIDDLTKAIEINPSAGRFYYSRGVAYDWLKEVDKALADYDKAIELKYDLRKSHAAKAGVHSNMKNFDKAIAELEAGAKFARTEENDETLAKLAKLYIAEEKFEKAKLSAQQWIEESHSDGSYKALISICKASNDKEKEKIVQNQHIENLTERIAQEPDDETLYEKRAALYADLGDKEKADADYSRALELCDSGDKEKDTIQWRQARKADINVDAGKTAEANELYREQIAKITKEISKSPQDQELYLNRAFALMKLHDYKAALKDFEKVSDSPYQDTTSRAKYDIAVAEKKYDQALALLKKNERPLTYGFYSQQAKVFEKMGKHADAIDAAHKALDLEKTKPLAYYWLGKALASSGQVEESNRRMQQATAYGYAPKEEN